MKIDFFSIALGILLASLHLSITHWMIRRSMFRLGRISFWSFILLLGGFLLRLTILWGVFFLLYQTSRVHIATAIVTFLITFTLLLPLKVRAELLHPYNKR